MSQANLRQFEYPRLTPAETEVYKMVEKRGLSREQVAARTDRRYSTVTTLLHRARAKRGEMPRV